MGRDTDFEFGANSAGSIADDLPECYGMVVCERCGKPHGRCDEITERAKEPERKSGMNIGQYITAGQGERNPFLTAKQVGKGCKAKVLGARGVATPKFNGIIVDLKIGDKKYAYGLRFDNGAIDLGNLVAQTGSDDTDDWLGETINLITRKGKKGRFFVNVAPGKNGKKR